MWWDCGSQCTVVGGSIFFFLKISLSLYNKERSREESAERNASSPLFSGKKGLSPRRKGNNSMRRKRKMNT